MRGHVWTLGPHLRHLVSPRKPPASRHWSTVVTDPARGRIRLTGRYTPADSSLGGFLQNLPPLRQSRRRVPPPSPSASRSRRGSGSLAESLPAEDSDALVVLVHGLGGSHRSAYMLDAAHVVRARGLASLRVNLRGADRRGADWYHAGLIDDVAAALEDPLVRSFRRVHLIGFSMGGHVSLALAARSEPRIASLASICAPLDLEAGAIAIDEPRGRVYRRHVLSGLKEIYREAVRNNPAPLDVSEAMKITTLREWDGRVIAPRFGFASAEHYWRSQSAGPILDRIDVPTLAVVTRQDPVVFMETLEPFIGTGNLRWAVIDGGHVGYPADVDLGVGERGSVIEQVVGWSCDPR